jgi:DoxX-like family
MIRVELPAHLRTLAKVDGEVRLEVEGPITLRAVLDALEAKYPMLCGTIREHETLKRRPFLRFFACEEDWSHEPVDVLLPHAVALGKEPLLVIGAVAGGLIEGEPMQSNLQSPNVSNGMIWTGRVLSGLMALFFVLDGVGHLMKPAPVVDAFARLGYPLSASVGIGFLLLICTAIYVTPKTSILGAILLTGYLGGAVSTHVRAGSSTFEMVFPVILGVVVWAGLFVRDTQLRSLFPVRR